MSFFNFSKWGHAFSIIGKGIVQIGKITVITAAKVARDALGITTETKHILSPDGFTEIMFEVKVLGLTAKELGAVIVWQYKNNMAHPCVIWQNPSNGSCKLLGHINKVAGKSVFSPMSKFPDIMAKYDTLNLAIIDEASMAVFV